MDFCGLINSILAKLSFPKYGDVVGTVGLLVSSYSLYLVLSIKKAVFSYRVNDRIVSMYEEIFKIPEEKNVTKTLERKIIQLCYYTQTFCISILPWRDRIAKKFIKNIKIELQRSDKIGNKRTPSLATIQQDLRTIRDNTLGVSKL